MKIAKCKAQNPFTCRYHGSALRMDEAVRSDNMSDYFKARQEFAEASKELEANRGRLSFLKPVTESPVVPLNPFRFTAEIEIKPEEGKVGIAKTITVHSDTRAGALDKMVKAAKDYYDNLKVTHPKLAYKKFSYYISYSYPTLDGRTDDEMSGSGGLGSLDTLVSSAAQTRELEVKTFNSRMLTPKIRNNTATEEEINLYERNQALPRQRSATTSNEEYLSPEYAAVNLVYKSETDKERYDRHKREDYLREVRRQYNIAAQKRKKSRG